MNQFDGHNYVCIVGCPRSGTTWLQKQLASHPQIATGQETHLFDIYFGPLVRAWRKALDQKRAVGLPGYLDDDSYRDAISTFLNNLLQPILGSLKPGVMFIDKTPCHILYVPEIVEYLPRTRFIHILRDPRDVVASLLSAARSWSPKWVAAATVRSAAAMWSDRVTQARRFASDLPAWQFYEVRYEDLNTDPARTLRGCCDFLGITWSDACLERAIQNNAIANLRNGAGTPIPLGGEASKREGAFVTEPPGFFRSGRVGSWKTDLTLREKAYLWYKLRNLMASVGYRW